VFFLTFEAGRYKEAFDDSEYVATMPDDDDDDEDGSPAESEWGASRGGGESDSESAASNRAGKGRKE
jgi:hypothetical protein